MIGISSACYYPEKTEDAFTLIAASGAPVSEVFINTYSEITPAYADFLRSFAAEHGFIINSVHPFTSFAEPYYFFSDYERRFDDGLELYKGFFENTRRIGASFFNFHGAFLTQDISPERYAEVLYKLSAAANESGVTLCQENVSRCLCGKTSYLKSLKPLLGDKAAFTLDIKQANRAGEDPFETAVTMGKALRLVHINDFDNEHDCLLPCRGTFDLKRLRDTLSEQGYRGNCIIEVYRKNYGAFTDINDALGKLTSLWENS